ncbi:MAG: hypothetical protein KBT29_10545 [Prevotellaceae bacterium]|nr:hypothetical protein [Candidatus Minthosoma caballi]
MNTTPLNPTQKYILQMFSYSPTEQTKQELQEVLTNFYFDKVANMGREIWNKMQLNQEKLDDLCNIHERTPYA